MKKEVNSIAFSIHQIASKIFGFVLTSKLGYWQTEGQSEKGNQDGGGSDNPTF